MLTGSENKVSKVIGQEANCIAVLSCHPSRRRIYSSLVLHPRAYGARSVAVAGR